MDMTSSKRPCFGHSLTIMIFPSRSIICALISPTFSVRRISTGTLPSRICCRISGMHFGHSESVSRGHPSGGFTFSQDFKSGLSDHFGVNEGFRWIELTLSKTNHAALAAYETTRSTYLTGLCMVTRLSKSFSLQDSQERLRSVPRYYRSIGAVL